MFYCDFVAVVALQREKCDGIACACAHALVLERVSVLEATALASSASTEQFLSTLCVRC